MGKRIYLCLAHMSGTEQAFIKEAFDTNWVVPLGPNVNGFEEDLKQFAGGGKEVVAQNLFVAAMGSIQGLHPCFIGFLKNPLLVLLCWIF